MHRQCECALKFGKLIVPLKENTEPQIFFHFLFPVLKLSCVCVWVRCTSFPTSRLRWFQPVRDTKKKKSTTCQFYLQIAELRREALNCGICLTLKVTLLHRWDGDFPVLSCPTQTPLPSPWVLTCFTKLDNSNPGGLLNHLLKFPQVTLHSYPHPGLNHINLKVKQLIAEQELLLSEAVVKVSCEVKRC